MALIWALTRIWPNFYRSRLIALSAKAGICEPSFVLSFDCDTDRDSTVVGDLHARLRERGLHPIYAVPGELLQEAGAVYRDIANDGAEFINHGYRRHAAVDSFSGKVISTYFYDAERPGEWAQDIRLGHSAVADVTGQVPRGFRTPHFGSFESPKALDALWNLLAGLGYHYSSSTRPLFAAAHGPVFRRYDIAEIPVSGCLDQPAQILDSWGLLNGTVEDDTRLLVQIRAYLQLMQSGLPVLLNMYFDPADITGETKLIDLLGMLAPYEVRGGFQALAAQV